MNDNDPLIEKLNIRLISITLIRYEILGKNDLIVLQHKNVVWKSKIKHKLQNTKN